MSATGMRRKDKGLELGMVNRDGDVGKRKKIKRKDSKEEKRKKETS
jgi:hypothetical protein